MPRMSRSRPPIGFFHVTTRAVAKTPAFFDDVDRVSFLRLLADCVTRFDWTLYAYCLMTTHYHLFVHARRDDLSRGMQRLNGLHARSVNKRLARAGHLFGARYSPWVVDSEEHARATCRYVLMNPVRAGLCDRAEDWRWSGSRYGKMA
jgi:putative transposase